MLAALFGSWLAASLVFVGCVGAVVLLMAGRPVPAVAFGAVGLLVWRAWRSVSL
jgi:hypothetical protein